MYFFNRIIFVLLGIIFIISGCIFTAACDQKKSSTVIKVGTIDGPETELMAIAKSVAKKNYGLTIEIVPFNDYTMPNMALSEGSIDANVFQHQPYLDESNKQHHFNLRSVGKTFIYPMAIYSKKIKTLADLRPNALVTIPNDPSNEARALFLLQEADLIKLKTGENSDLTPQDIVANPLHLNIKELDTALLTRTLEDADVSVINSNYAVPADLFPKRDGLFSESNASLYANIIVVRNEEKAKPVFKQLEAALHSPEVEKAAQEIFHNIAIPAWK